MTSVASPRRCLRAAALVSLPAMCPPATTTASPLISKCAKIWFWLLYVCEIRREEIIDVLKKCYYVKKQKNIPMFYVTVKDLRDFTTTEKDMKKDVVRFPTPNYRTTEEDIFDEASSAAAAQS